MGRKTITYARKRGRIKQAPMLQTQSSPIQTLTDSDGELSYSEMSRRMLKRSRQSANQRDTAEKLPKKLKIDGQGHDATCSSPAHCHGLQTPQNIAADDNVDTTHSLRSGSRLTDSFSPVPVVSALFKRQVLPTRRSDRTGQKPHSKTSSSNLKENAIPSLPRTLLKRREVESIDGLNASRCLPKSKQTSFGNAHLDSPFTSKPSSPQQSSKVRPDQGEPRPTSETNFRRTLSDTHFNPNIPSHRGKSLAHIQSTSNSPVSRYEDESMKARRPSAPSATSQRPDPTSWFPSYNPAIDVRDQIISSSSFFLSGYRNRNPSIDFNRPPSQLCYNLGYNDAFFSDALEVSTPFRKKAHRYDSIISPDSSSGSTDEEDSNRTLQPTLSDMQLTQPLLFSSDILGPWISDSLISAPTLSNIHSCARDSLLDDDVDMPSATVDSLGLDDESISGTGIEGSSKRLQDLFDKLDLGSSRPPLRTRSLDTAELDHVIEERLESPAQISPCNSKLEESLHETKRTGRDRRGTIRASDLSVGGASALLGPRRTRSGTVIQGPTRRERSDTIVARPSVSGLAPTPSTLVVDVDMRDVNNTIVDEKPEDREDVPMLDEEQEDELNLLGDNWVDEKWVPAAPPSPILPRRKRRVNMDWKRRLDLRKTRDMGHEQDDGEDDPLLLK
ncbi:hypothetical protein H0H92_001052 [Tricholoma furcatifolium]|nr:hypothetical protein H0H92_001052 [Tricholoma furcatifolium]